MHAQQLDTPAPIEDNPLQWREIATPEPGPAQVLIHVKACGVCRSNLHVIVGDWTGDGLPAKSPIIPGHEVTGIVEKVGDGVTEFKPGDRVGVQPMWRTCEHCEYCTSGREELCPEFLATGEHVDGGYAEYMLSNQAHTYHVPDALDLVEAAPLFCPGITAYGAVDKLGLTGGEKVGVFGPGGVGHMAIQFAAIKGAQVVAIGRTQKHLDVAVDVGAASTVNTSDPSAVDALEGTLDAALTFADSDVVTANAIASLKPGATLVNVVPISFSGFTFQLNQRIQASKLGNRRQMHEMLQIAASGKVRTVNERFDMSQANLALNRLAAGQLGSRAVLVNNW